MRIVCYPHPALRYESKAIQRVDARLKQIVREMFELMYAHRGVGLAANQVDLPIQLFIVNEGGEPGTGDELVFINPVIQSPKGSDEAEEGCLSIPGVYGNVSRPAQVRIAAYDLAGNEINRTVDGMLARVVQHEFDHLSGVLFPDRMSVAARKAIQDELDSFDSEFRALQRAGREPADEQIASQLAEWEAQYCR